ncbi:hypothetical protein F4802DRAFT_597021 [Xylaria palmicola]|nr:hypothetical protein F4802DRAFT_597021 [Xylaria palmicola]
MSPSIPSIKRLFVGIGGGVPSAKRNVRLGEAVTSMPESEQTGGFLWPLPALLRNAAQDMRSEHPGRGNRIKAYMETMFNKWLRMASYRQPPDPDLFFCTDQPHLDDGPALTAAIPLRPSLDRRTVIKNAALRDGIARRHDVLCFEMEAAGPMTEYPSMVIRLISDYADSHKNGRWQRYAPATAAACAKELLSYVDPEVAADEPTPTPRT